MRAPPKRRGRKYRFQTGVESFLEPAPLRPLTHHHDSEIPVAPRQESLLELHDPANILLGGRSSHIPNGEYPTPAVTELWAEACSVDAVRHQEAWLAGGLLKHLDHLRIGGEQAPRCPYALKVFINSAAVSRRASQCQA
jgi:hypothetical protein